MAITVNLRTNDRIVTNRKFDVNTGISVYGKFTGAFGVGEPGTFYRVEILDSLGNSLEVKENNADIFGDYDFYFITPDKPCRLTIKIIATYSISGKDTSITPIGIGGLNPDDLPEPEEEKSLLDYLPIILLIMLGVFLYFTYVQSKRIGVLS